MDTPVIIPPYQIRKSKKAKRLQLQFTPEKGLEVVIPYRMRFYSLDLLFAQHKDWIQKMISQLAPAKPWALPEQLSLLAIDQLWQVHYQEIKTPTLRLKQHDLRLHLIGPTSDPMRVQKKLKTWIFKQAETYLHDMLKHLSLETGLAFQSMKIRAQKTRWGSCDRSGHITLNCQLLFLPKPLVRHILLHELCHTRHFNHSTSFWQLVSQYDPDWHNHRQLSRQAERYIPDWLKSSPI